MKKVLLVNQGHTDNIGDQLISKVMCEHLSDFCNITVSKFIPGESSSRIELNNSVTQGENGNGKRKRLSDKLKQNYSLSLALLTLKYYRKIVEEVKERYDVILIGGGELLADYVVFTAAMQAWLLYSRKTKTKAIIYGVSGFPFEKKKHRFFRWLLDYCDLVCVRDKSTQSHLCQYMNKTIHYAPDVVFSMNRVMNCLFNPNKSEKNIFVSVYSTEELGVKPQNILEYFAKWTQVITREIKDSTECLLVGYTTQSDFRTATKFYHYLIENPISPNVKVKLCDYSDWEGYCKSVSKCNCVITGRMHAMIIALQCGCRIIPYTVKHKISVFKSEYVDKEYDMYSVNQAILSSIELLKEKIGT